MFLFFFLGGHLKNLFTLCTKRGIRGKSVKKSQVKKILLFFIPFCLNFSNYVMFPLSFSMSVGVNWAIRLCTICHLIFFPILYIKRKKI